MGFRNGRSQSKFSPAAPPGIALGAFVAPSKCAVDNDCALGVTDLILLLAN